MKQSESTSERQRETEKRENDRANEREAERERQRRGERKSNRARERQRDRERGGRESLCVFMRAGCGYCTHLEVVVQGVEVLEEVPGGGAEDAEDAPVP